MAGGFRTPPLYPREREGERERVGEKSYFLTKDPLANGRWCPKGCTGQPTSRKPYEMWGGLLAGGFCRPFMPWGERERERSIFMLIPHTSVPAKYLRVGFSARGS